MIEERPILVLEGPLNPGLADLLAEEGWLARRIADVVQLLREADQARLIVIDTQAPEMTVDVYRQLRGRATAPWLLITTRVFSIDKNMRD